MLRFTTGGAAALLSGEQDPCGAGRVSLPVAAIRATVSSQASDHSRGARTRRHKTPEGRCPHGGVARRSADRREARHR